MTIAGSLQFIRIFIEFENDYGVTGFYFLSQFHTYRTINPA